MKKNTMGTLFEGWRSYINIRESLEEPIEESDVVELEEEDLEEMAEGCGDDVDDGGSLGLNISSLLNDPHGTGQASWSNDKGTARIAVLDET